MRFNIYMQVQSIQNHFLYNYSSSTAFKGSVAITKASAAAAKGLTELKHIYAGTYGTYLEGSRALTDFFSCMAPNIRENIVKRGLSTNIDSVANCFLKSKWDNPISTSGVFDCSVLYLANEKTQTHFLYHMFKDVDYAKIQKIIKQFMPEGFTQAAIVPGDKKNIAEHKKYLYEVFKAVKNANPEAKIDAYHFSTKNPEIVGYKGIMYEIPKENWQNYGQNSFKIQDINYYDKLYLADIYNSASALEEVSKLIAEENIDEEAQKTIQKYIQDKIASLTPKSKISRFITKIKDNIHLLMEHLRLMKNSLC